MPAKVSRQTRGAGGVCRVLGRGHRQLPRPPARGAPGPPVPTRAAREKATPQDREHLRGPLVGVAADLGSRH